MAFTAKQIENLKPDSERYDLREGGRTGFAVRVFPTGQKSWIFFYTYQGKKRRMTLGAYPDKSLAEARKLHAEALSRLAKGIDPAEADITAREERIASPTVQNLVEEFLLRHVTVKAPRSRDEYARNLEKDVLPAWGRRKARDITRRDVIALLEGVLDRGAQNQANQVFKIVRKMFNFAIERDIIEHTPCAGREDAEPGK
jgi:hypothetical protein